SHERQRRAGTENVPAIVGFGKAAEIAVAGIENGEVARLEGLRDHLQQTVLSEVDECVINGGDVSRVPTTTNIRFGHIEGEALVIALDLKGLSVSTGAACSSGTIEPSHVLTAMGLSPAQARGSIRFSLGKQNTQQDIEFAVSIVPETVARLRELSPLYKKAAVRSQKSAVS
ncbi:MAG TPA: aminotransferase class V-fold PLP-dependent enzyme, partial [Terriglobales bacterium]|nr:aminotransferase class V-fold PLP-dependent enzyme [Terriglobales bacterium]